MKICLLADRIPPESSGGAEQIAWRSALALAARGHEVSLITTTKKPLNVVQEEMREGVRLFTIHSEYHERWRAWRSLNNRPVVMAVQSILDHLRPDIVHAHNIHFHLSYESLRVAKSMGSRVFLTSHDVMPFHYGKLIGFADPANPICKTNWNYKVSPWQQLLRFKWRYNPFRNRAIRTYIREVDGFFAVSHALQDALVQNGLPQPTVLYNGIDVPSWSASQASVEAFEERFVLKNRRIIFFGGRLTGMKGGTQLLEALQKVVPEAPSTLLLVAAARDRYLEAFERRAKECGIGEHVRVTGWLSGEELRAAYHIASVTTTPSICFDSFPTMNLEAMACSTPVVTTCFGGAAEQVVEGETGYIVNPYDIKTFAARLTELLQDSKRRVDFGTAGHIRVQREFSQEEHVSKLEQYYIQGDF